LFVYILAQAKHKVNIFTYNRQATYAHEKAHKTKPNAPNSGTKKAKNSHLKIKFFQKNLRAAETAPKREKKQVILLYRTAEDQTSNADNS